jgi:hypothetical protein
MRKLASIAAVVSQAQNSHVLGKEVLQVQNKQGLVYRGNGWASGLNERG